MIKYFKKFNRFEIIFLTTAIIAPIILAIIFNATILETLAGITMLICALLFAKARPEGYILAFISVILYMIVAYQVSVYGEIIIGLLLIIPLNIYGLIAWYKNKNQAHVNLVKTPIKEIILLIISQLIMVVGYYFLLKTLNTQFLIISSISIMGSFIATYLVARRSQYGMLAYLVNDIILIILWTMVVIDGNLGALILVLTPILLLFNDIYGTFNWAKLMKKQGVKNMQIKIQDHTLSYFVEEKQLAFIEFITIDSNVIDVKKVFVDESLRGQGIAGKLMLALYEYCQKNQLKVIATCPYANGWFMKNESYQDILINTNQQSCQI